jgi:hypothetical protein
VDRRLCQRGLLVALLLAAFSLSLLSAQDVVRPLSKAGEYRRIEGVVTDHNGNPLQGSVVQVENGVTRLVRSYITDAQGQYHFAELDPNADYYLRARYGNASSSEKRVSIFRSRDTVVMNLKVKAGN